MCNKQFWWNVFNHRGVVADGDVFKHSEEIITLGFMKLDG